MDSSKYAEKSGQDPERGTTGTGSTAYQSDGEKEAPKGYRSEPDIDHDDVEQMDEGHLDDLARERVSLVQTPFAVQYILTEESP